MQPEWLWRPETHGPKWLLDHRRGALGEGCVTSSHSTRAAAWDMAELVRTT